MDQRWRNGGSCCQDFIICFSRGRRRRGIYSYFYGCNYLSLNSETSGLEGVVVWCVKLKEFGSKLGGIGLEMEIYASIGGGLDLIRWNQEVMNCRNCRNQKSILLDNTDVLL